MARANAAYYAGQDPFRDFTTAPEITQAFGEVLGAWAGIVWQTMGKPDPVLLVELGPGRGTLMRDALRAVQKVLPPFRAAVQVHLVEASPRLREQQRTAVPEAAAAWHDSLDSVPRSAPAVILANEFLDALPIRQFARRGAGWTERWVEKGRFVERPAEAPAADARVEGAPDGSVLEVGQAALAVAAQLGARVAREGGAALLLDYGPSRSAPGESLQALRGGRPADPLLDPGTADLTAHVDFAAAARAGVAAGAAVHGPAPQGSFLVRLGLMQRVFALARQARDPAGTAAQVEAARRLVEPTGMGSLFKVLALCHPSLPSPPGFEDA